MPETTKEERHDWRSHLARFLGPPSATVALVLVIPSIGAPLIQGVAVVLAGASTVLLALTPLSYALGALADSISLLLTVHNKRLGGGGE